MAKFKLSPIAERLSDSIWQHSEPPHEPCYVGAGNESDARNYAASHFRPVTPIRKGEKIDYTSPWLDSAVAACAEIVELGRDRMPEGLVQRQSENHRAP